MAESVQPNGNANVGFQKQGVCDFPFPLFN